MKKSYKWTLVVFLALLVVVALTLVACTPDNTDDDDVWTIERVYAQAQELGYQGTLDELIAQFKGADGTDGVDGKDGVGIKTMEINDDGELIVTLTNGTELNLGVIVGATGPQGPQGPQGATGPQGPQGPAGQDGKPAENIHTFTVTFVAEGREVGKVVCLDGTTFVSEPDIPQKEHYTATWESYTLADADITVQAVYTPIEYRVTFAGNGQQDVRTYTVETVDELTAPEVPTKEHYTGAWQGYELQFDNDQVVNAVYTAIEYTATFDDGTKQTTVTYTADNANSVTIPQVTPKQYYNGSWQQYRFDFSNEQVIHAEYTLIEYKVTFTGNGEQEVRTYTVETAEEVTAPEVPEKEHYTGIWQEYELQFEQNQVVNAVYTPIEYKITFVGNGQSIERTYNAETTSQFVAPEVPVKEQYYGFDYVGAWERFDFEFDDSQEVNAMYTLNTPGYTYILNGDKQSYSLTNVSNDIEEAHVLPFYNDLPVTSIGTAFYYCTNLQSVTFKGDSQLQTISDEAFRGCRNLQTVTFEGNSQLQSIGLLAFYDCSNLTEITIPNTVTNIGNSAFYGCSSLTSITIPSTVTSIGDRAFYYCISLQTVTFDGESQLQSIGNYAFENCGRLTNVYYGGTIKSWCGIEFIHDDYSSICPSNPMCYADHFFMKQGDDWQEVSGKIEIPESITAIGDYQFLGFKISSVVIPSNTTKIGAYAFYACDALKEITFSDDIHLIGIDSSAFGGCDNLKNIYYGGTIERWCGIEFGTSGANPMYYTDHFFMKQGDDWQEVTEIDIPEGVDKIGDYQFYGFGNITSITIPSTVTSIGDNAFYNCKALQTATFEGESQLQSIGDYAFYGCSSLTSITISSTVTSIGNYAFNGCNSLQTATFEGDSPLQSIGDYAFSGCSSLTSIIIPRTVTNIGQSAFSSCLNLTIYCETTSEPLGWHTHWNPSNRPVVWDYKNQ